MRLFNCILLRFGKRPLMILLVDVQEGKISE